MHALDLTSMTLSNRITYSLIVQLETAIVVNNIGEMTDERMQRESVNIAK